MAQPELNLPILFEGFANGRSGVFTYEANIYNSNEKFWSSDRALSVLMPERTHPVTTSEVFLLSSSCDKNDKAVISR